jgi:plastocyanin
MSTSPWRTTALLLITVAAACGGDSTGSPGGPVLTTLEVRPQNAVIFTLPPEDAVLLQVFPRDQHGLFMSASATFVSSNDAIARVDAGGVVSAGAAGTATITTTVTISGITKTVQTPIQVREAPASATVTAPGLVFQPDVVHVSRGGSVTWTMQAIPHDVVFSSPGAPANVPVTTSASAIRIFPQSGTFGYACTLHSGMTGLVYVH